MYLVRACVDAYIHLYGAYVRVFIKHCLICTPDGINFIRFFFAFGVSYIKYTNYIWQPQNENSVYQKLDEEHSKQKRPENSKDKNTAKFSRAKDSDALTPTKTLTIFSVS